MANLQSTSSGPQALEAPVAPKDRLQAAIVAIVSVALGWRFFHVIHQYSVNLFFSDQWDYLRPFFDHDKPGLTELFLYQHGPHREGIGLFADKFLYPLNHWNTTADSYFIGGCIFAAMLLALSLKQKLIGPLVIQDVAIPAIFLTLAQYETVIGTPNPAYSGLPLLMTMVYCHALLLGNTLLRYAAILLLDGLLIYTGFGLFMGAVTIGVVLLECYWSWRGMTRVPLIQAITALVIASALLASFFVDYQWAPYVDCFEPPRHRLWAYPWFMAIMFSRFLGSRHYLPLITTLGAILLAGAFAVMVLQFGRLVHRGSEPESVVGAVLLSYSLLFSANSAVGRICLGLPAAAQASRYVTLMIPAFVGIYFFLMTCNWSRRNLLLLPFVAIVLVGAAIKTTSDYRWLGNGKRAWADCYRSTGNILFCDQTTKLTIFPPAGRDRLQRRLDFLSERHLNLFADSNAK